MCLNIFNLRSKVEDAVKLLRKYINLLDTEENYENEQIQLIYFKLREMMEFFLEEFEQQFFSHSIFAQIHLCLAEAEPMELENLSLLAFVLGHYTNA